MKLSKSGDYSKDSDFYYIWIQSLSFPHKSNINQIIYQNKTFTFIFNRSAVNKCLLFLNPNCGVFYFFCNTSIKRINIKSLFLSNDSQISISNTPWLSTTEQIKQPKLLKQHYFPFYFPHRFFPKNKSMSIPIHLRPHKPFL